MPFRFSNDAEPATVRECADFLEDEARECDKTVEMIAGARDPNHETLDLYEARANLLRRLARQLRNRATRIQNR